MMKDTQRLQTLVIATEGRRFSIKLPVDACNEAFNQMLLSVIEPEQRNAVEKTNASLAPTENPMPEKHTVTVSPGEPKGYKGFLYIKCAHCGNAWGFNARENTTSCTCRECGKEAELISMVPLYVNCECGGRFKYFTNLTDPMADIQCLNCSSPVPVEYNQKSNSYETMR